MCRHILVSQHSSPFVFQLLVFASLSASIQALAVFAVHDMLAMNIYMSAVKHAQIMCAGNQACATMSHELTGIHAHWP